jgi:hypothetical protein
VRVMEGRILLKRRLANVPTLSILSPLVKPVKLGEHGVTYKCRTSLTREHCGDFLCVSRPSFLRMKVSHLETDFEMKTRPTQGST